MQLCGCFGRVCPAVMNYDRRTFSQTHVRNVVMIMRVMHVQMLLVLHTVEHQECTWLLPRIQQSNEQATETPLGGETPVAPFDPRTQTLATSNCPPVEALAKLHLVGLLC